jgi:Polyketide cyclase / dehydrase and lipid transport
MSAEPAWTCQASVEADVPASFAWDYMTDVRNWNDPPAEFALEGAFADGSRGTTSLPGRAAVHWTIGSVDPGRAYTITSMLPEGASLLFHWEFAALRADKTRLTQRLELHGEDAPRHVHDVRAAFESNLEPGMRRIAAMMQAAAAQRG